MTTRREFIRTAALGSIAAGANSAPGLLRHAATKTNAAQAKPLPLIHQADLFRPHGDSDDHWDLACVYALAAQRLVDLRGLLIDYSRSPIHEPDAGSLAQMNYIHGLSVPFVVGSSIKVTKRDETQRDAPAHERNGVKYLLRTLSESPAPVAINIVGSSRDVALAANLEPKLFRRKCAAIYLNAGSGTPFPERVTELEHNVKMDPTAYAAIFDIDCPIYWLPSYEAITHERISREYATYWRFQQKDILNDLPPLLRNYFAFALSRSESHRWLDFIRNAKTGDIIKEQGEKFRNMWSTAGMFHAAGFVVDCDGRRLPVKQASGNAAYSFDPIRVSCSDRGVTRWQPDARSKNRFIFHVRNLDCYASAMKQAMKDLLIGGEK